MGPNILRPRIQAPIPVIDLAEKSLSIPVSPLFFCIFWKVSVGKNHSITLSPPGPNGSSRVCPGAELYPSIEMAKLATRTLDIGHPSTNVASLPSGKTSG